MKHHGKFTALPLGVLLGIAFAAGGVQRTLAAEPTPNAQAQQANVLRETLGNGLQVVIVRDALAPTVTTQITYKAGGYDTLKAYPGTAHALEHMMFRDSDGLTGAQLNQMAGKMGARSNAFTTADATQYFFVAPAQYTDLLLKIEATRMRGAEVNDKQWGLEKGAIEQEVSRNISKPGYLAFMEAQRLLFAGTGYAESALGTRPSFDKTTGATLQAFYDRWYVPNNAVLVVVGDVDPQATMRKVKALFSAIPRGEVPNRAPLQLQPLSPKTIARTTPDATGAVEFIYRLPGQRSPDYAAAKVLMGALDNARSDLSRLAAEGKVLNTTAMADSYAHAGMGFLAAGVPEGGDMQAAQARLQGVIEGFLKNGVPADLVAATKRKMRAEFEFDKNSATGIASSWSQAIAWRGLDSPRDALELLDKVTAADVDRVARQYLRADQRVTVVLTPDQNGKRPPDSAGFGGVESFAGDDKGVVPLPEWADKALGDLKMPHWTLNPVSMKLDNGMTLVVQPTDVSKTVTVVGHVDHNDKMQEPRGKEGVGQLLGQLFDYGTTELDRDAFHSELDKIAARESAGSQFYLMVPSEHFDRGMQLLAANELAPALPQQAFKVKQESLARTLAGQIKTPRYKQQRAAYKALLPAGDPELREATPGTVNDLTLADAKDYFSQVFRPDMTTIVVVGDVTPAQAKAVVEKYFSAWRATGPKPDVVPQPVPVNGAHYAVIPDSYASQDNVVMVQMMDINLHNRDRYALELGNAVLGGNGFASRLMTDIRVKHGFAYGAGSGLQFDRSRSMFFVSYGSDPDKVAAVDRLISENLQAMRTTTVSAKELVNAKQAQIRSIPLGVSSVNGIALSLLTSSYKGLPLDEPMLAAQHYLRLTAEDVRSAFRKYVKPDNLVQVVLGPDPKKK